MKKISNKKAKEDKIYKRNRELLIKEQIDNYGYNFCEICKKNNPTETHHIIARSKLVSNPKKHDLINLIIVCRDCHNELEKHTELNNKLIEQRNLKQYYE